MTHRDLNQARQKISIKLRNSYRNVWKPKISRSVSMLSGENDRLCITESTYCAAGYASEYLKQVAGWLSEAKKNCFDSTLVIVCRSLSLTIYLTEFLVPVIIVFTQYDNLYNYTDFKLPINPSLNEHDRKKMIEAKTDAYFQKECVEKLKLLGEQPKKLKWVKVSSMYLSTRLHTYLCGRSGSGIHSDTCGTHPGDGEVDPQLHFRGSLGCSSHGATNRRRIEGCKFSGVCSIIFELSYLTVSGSEWKVPFVPALFQCSW